MTASPIDLMHFAPEPETPEAAPRPARASLPWKILVVDDDDDVHVMTELLLNEVEFDGRGLHFLHAFSGKAARDIFAEQDDIAVAFVDVVMEHDLAGLDLVRHVRDDLGNREISLILRTGQPGVAPERRIIMDYAINDYKSKTELTADRLVTSTIGALRHYQLCTDLKRARYNEVLTLMQLEAEARDKRRLEQRLNAERRGELAVLGDAMEDYVHTELMAGIADINRRVLPLRLSLRSELHGEEYESFIATLAEVAERLGGVAETLRGIIGATRPD